MAQCRATHHPLFRYLAVACPSLAFKRSPTAERSDDTSSFVSRFLEAYYPKLVTSHPDSSPPRPPLVTCHTPRCAKVLAPYQEPNPEDKDVPKRFTDVHSWVFSDMAEDTVVDARQVITTVAAYSVSPPDHPCSHMKSPRGAKRCPVVLCLLTAIGTTVGRQRQA